MHTPKHMLLVFLQINVSGLLPDIYLKMVNFDLILNKEITIFKEGEDCG